MMARFSILLIKIVRKILTISQKVLKKVKKLKNNELNKTSMQRKVR